MDRQIARQKYENMRSALRMEMDFLYTANAIYDQIIMTMKNEPELLNIAPAFFQVIKKALWATIIHWTFKLANDKSSFGILRYLQFIEKNASLLTDAERPAQDLCGRIEADRKKLQEFAPILKGVIGRRHKYYGHFNEEFLQDVDKLNTRFPVKWKELLSLWQLIGEILNRYSIAYDKSAQSFGAINAGDIQRIFGLIRKEEKRIKGNVALP